MQNNSKPLLRDQPQALPKTMPAGEPVKNFIDTVLERRATNHFSNEAVPDEYLRAILALAAQAPSGYNLQPWRFVVVRDPENRKRLQRAAFNQAKIGEAPVVVVAFAMKDEVKKLAGEILREGTERGLGKPEAVEDIRNQAVDFLESMSMEVWLNRHVMIAVTTMMLAAETYGFDTAPMEGFDGEAVKREFNIPNEGVVVALLAIGRLKDRDKKYPGRFPAERIAFYEAFPSS